MKPFALVLLLASSLAVHSQTAVIPSEGVSPSRGTAPFGLAPQERYLIQAAQQPIIPVDAEGAKKANALLDRTVQALGGDKYLSFQTVHHYGRSYSLSDGTVRGQGVRYWRYFRYPDHERIELTKDRDWIIIYAGDKAYETTFRGTRELEQKALREYLARRDFGLDYILRDWRKDPQLAVFYDGSTIAESKSAEKVTLINGTNQQVTLYLDSQTGLPLKKEYELRDPTTGERSREYETYDQYRSVQGIMTPHVITRYKDGEMASQRFIKTVEYDVAIPDAKFAAVIDYNRLKKY
jgi:hypothetical protein